MLTLAHSNDQRIGVNTHKVIECLMVAVDLTDENIQVTSSQLKTNFELKLRFAGIKVDPNSNAILKVHL